MDSLAVVLKEHPFLQGMKHEHIELIARCATNVRFEPGTYMMREGDEAEQWFLVRSGRVALETDAPGVGPVVLNTVGENEVIGWSWLVSPYIWHHSGRVLMPTRAFALDGVCLRGKCDRDHELGYELMKRFLQVIQGRLVSARLQMLDLYKPSRPRREAAR